MFLGSCQSLLRVCKAAFDERDENIWGFLLEIFFYFLHFVWTNFKTFSAFCWNFFCGIFKTAFYVSIRSYRRKIFVFLITSGTFAKKSGSSASFSRQQCQNSNLGVQKTVFETFLEKLETICLFRTLIENFQPFQEIIIACVVKNAL